MISTQFVSKNLGNEGGTGIISFPWEMFFVATNCHYFWRKRLFLHVAFQRCIVQLHTWPCLEKNVKVIQSLELTDKNVSYDTAAYVFICTELYGKWNVYICNSMAIFCQHTTGCLTRKCQFYSFSIGFSLILKQGNIDESVVNFASDTLYMKE